MQGAPLSESVSTCAGCRRTPQSRALRSGRAAFQARAQQRPASARPPRRQRHHLSCRASGEDDPFGDSGQCPDPSRRRFPVICASVTYTRVPFSSSFCERREEICKFQSSFFGSF